MHKHFVGLGLLALGMSASTAHAQSTLSSDFLSRIELGVFGQYTKADSVIQMKNVTGLGVALNAKVYKWFGVEANMNYGPSTSTRGVKESFNYSAYRALGTVTFPEATPVALVLGAGYVVGAYKGRNSSAGYYEKDGFAAQAGLKVCGNNSRWGARADAIMDYDAAPDEPNLGETINYHGRVGITYALHGTCAGAAEKFDWALAMAPAAATVAKGASRQFALSAGDMKQRPIETRKVNDLACTSSDASVATVDNTGNVKAVKYGSATISCKGLVKKIERSASAAVTVPPPAWTFTMDGSTQSRNVGQTVTYATTAKDADGVDLGSATSWTSSNTGVATVNNGTVTCVGGGTTTITATKNAYGTTKSATATLTCIAPPPPPTGMIRLDSTQFNFDKVILLPAGKQMLQTVIDAMKRDPSIKVSVEGHTDWYGTDAYNDKLSTTRATTVMKALTKMAGKDLAADRFSMKGYGEQCIIVKDGDPDPAKPRPHISAANKAKQAPNRRVEIWQVAPGESGSPASCRSEAQRDGRVPFASMK